MSEAKAAVRIGNVVLWVLQVALAAYIIYSGYTLFGDNYVKKFDEIGFGQWLRYVTGVLEIAGGLGLLIPRLCGLAALGLVGVMAGAVGTELFLLAKGGPMLPAILLAAAAVIAWFRRDTIKALVSRS
ncbi:DoxX-like family protein [Amycolatopsis xylanica]|uniref:DoxX-like family protein n=1 Tax=Amycolatopsis xylanica TaxID=589385 RepID=A0A1H2S633_9PSEU|nr:DoxX family protein [Amycolatopsis xylanica]SDW27071.1 DoxX-like family protein [Amycolatopsis xylanica]